MRLLLSAALVVAVAAPAFAQPAPRAPKHIRGTIVSSTTTSLVVNDPSGSKTVTLGPTTHYLSVVKSSLDKINAGTFIGTAVAPQKNGSLRALEVVIFPKAMNGTGEGFYPWDSQPHSMMANATVQHVGTNVSSVHGRTLSLVYHGGSKTVDVPASVPVVMFRPGNASILKKNAHVFVIPAPGDAMAGAATAAAVAVGADGVVPPM